MKKYKKYPGFIIELKNNLQLDTFKRMPKQMKKAWFKTWHSSNK